MGNRLADSIFQALQLWQGNIGWMSWNLFLGVVPLFISFWLFHKPRSRWLRWGVPFLLGITFFFGVQRYDFRNVINILVSLRTAFFGVDTIYLLAIVIGTLILMVLDLWFWRGRGSRSVVWWIGFLAFITFLPNAPYVLTDVIHLIKDIRQIDSTWVLTLAVIPQFLLFMIVGFEAYVLSLIYLGNYLKRHDLGKYILPTELIIHGLTAIGIYLGRFERFNTWHIITQPDNLFMSVMNDLARRFSLVIIVVTFIVLVVLYWVMKQLTIGVMLRVSRARASRQENDFPGISD